MAIIANQMGFALGPIFEDDRLADPLVFDSQLTRDRLIFDLHGGYDYGEDPATRRARLQ